jgi:single-stranded-DNA-specific exonuclease
LNANRQELERNMLADIQATLARQPELLDHRTLVLAHPDWHEGVIGIVASKLMEMYYRPAVLIALKDGHGRGSARSIPGIDLFACLSACRMHLDEVGGHMQAAGLHLAESRLPAFRQAFEETVAAAAGAQPFIPSLNVDCMLDLSDISEELVDQIEALRPFGSGNPEPLFMARDVVVASSTWVGNHHRRMTLRPASGHVDRSFRAIQFHADPRTAAPNRFERLLFKLRWNRWNGNKTVQLLVEAAFAG